MTEKARLFAGIRVPPLPAFLEARTTLITRADTLALTLRATDPLDLHLTLFFLGMVPKERIGAIKAALAEVALRRSRFSLTATNVGAFPQVNPAKVVWAGLARSSEILELASAAEAACTELGFEREPKPFAPHITLARLKPPADARELIRDLSTRKFGEFAVTELLLYESKGGTSAPRYHPLAAFPLIEKHTNN